MEQQQQQRSGRTVRWLIRATAAQPRSISQSGGRPKSSGSPARRSPRPRAGSPGPWGTLRKGGGRKGSVALDGELGLVGVLHRRWGNAACWAPGQLLHGPRCAVLGSRSASTPSAARGRDLTVAHARRLPACASRSRRRGAELAARGTPAAADQE